MFASEAATKLGITQRMLRHYEKAGLITVKRAENGYRYYSEADLRRVRRIHDFISVGFSTRELRAMSACLSDDGAGPCAGGLDKLSEKLIHVEKLITELSERRHTIKSRIEHLEIAFSHQEKSAKLAANAPK